MIQKENILEKSMMISLQDLEYSILKNLNLHVREGEIYSIIGKNDSGKSELLRCINRINQPKYGKITVDNQNLNSLSEKDFNNLRRKIVLITKNPQLIISKNVLDNIAIPLELPKNMSRTEINKIVESTANLVGVSDKLFNFPGQLNILQKQLVSLARALVTKPKVLLCDDITYHLDVKSTHQIVNLLNFINKEFGSTIIIVSNDIEVIKSLSHKVGVMHKGEIVEESSALEIFARPKTEFAKELVKAASRQEMPWVYRRKIRFQSTQNQHPIIRISFTTNNLATEHLLGYLIQSYQFKINIIQAYQEQIQQHPINVILAEVEGTGEDFTEIFNEAMLFLKNHELHIEVLGYVANSI